MPQPLWAHSPAIHHRLAATVSSADPRRDRAAREVASRATRRAPATSTGARPASTRAVALTEPIVATDEGEQGRVAPPGPGARARR